MQPWLSYITKQMVCKFIWQELEALTYYDLQKRWCIYLRLSDRDLSFHTCAGSLKSSIRAKRLNLVGLNTGWVSFRVCQTTLIFRALSPNGRRVSCISEKLRERAL